MIMARRVVSELKAETKFARTRHANTEADGESGRLVTTTLWGKIPPLVSAYLTL